ncbi:hypothetical protein CROQUDRAFT_88295 [Cronartium quercuum f. sp. fusiforme G11]|uniref:Uncharacterized protein n=1 Tax=Cronartium quercuum f. sp. fusiforme G11 TaxID=708437 RepID=A0A9P6NVJ8_9BASI|nr:hypothetical protein CROQUDRAFT_88295 [Cronartium quercuum f. sp. fusiforme G11]
MTHESAHDGTDGSNNDPHHPTSVSVCSKPSAVPIFPNDSLLRQPKAPQLPVIPSELFDALSRTRTSSPPPAPVVPTELFSALSRTRPIGPPDQPTPIFTVPINNPTLAPHPTRKVASPLAPVRSKILSKLVASVSTHPHLPRSQPPSSTSPDLPSDSSPISTTHSQHPQGHRNRSLGFLPDIPITPINLDLRQSEPSRPLSIRNSSIDQPTVTERAQTPVEPNSRPSKRKTVVDPLAINQPKSQSISTTAAVRSLLHLRGSHRTPTVPVSRSDHPLPTPHSSESVNPTSVQLSRLDQPLRPYSPSGLTPDLLTSENVPSPHLPTVDSPSLEQQSGRSSFIYLPSVSQSTTTVSQCPVPPHLPTPSSEDHSSNTQESFMSNLTTPKTKETIWNRMGFNHTSFGSSSSASGRKMLLKQHQHQLADVPTEKLLRDVHLPHSAQSAIGHQSSLSPSSSRARTSFSLDHYIHSHLNNHNEKKSLLSQRRHQTGTKDSVSSSRRPKSKPEGSRTGNLLSKRSSLKAKHDVQEAGSELGSPALAHSSSELSTQSSLDHLDLLNSRSLNENLGNGNEEDILEEDAEDVPWPNRENFTHDLHAGRRREQFMDPEDHHRERGQDESVDDDGSDCAMEHSEDQPHDPDLCGRMSTSNRRPHIHSTGSADSPHATAAHLRHHRQDECHSPTSPSTTHRALPGLSLRHVGRSHPASMAPCQSQGAARAPSVAPLPFRLSKDAQKTFFNSGMRDSLDARRAAMTHSLDPLAMRFKSSTAPVSSPATSTESKYRSPNGIEDFNVPHTAPLCNFPSFYLSSGPPTPTRAVSNLLYDSQRARSLSDTLYRRATRAYHYRHHREFQDLVFSPNEPGEPGQTENSRLRATQETKALKQIPDSESVLGCSLESHHLKIFNGTFGTPTAGRTTRLADEPNSEEVQEDGPGYLLDTPAARTALNVKADFTIGVAGPKGVGKTTIITRALRRPVTDPVILYEDERTNKIISYLSSVSNGAGHQRTVQVLEVDQAVLEEKIVKKDHKEGLIWPKCLPPLDGILLCYDAMDPTALDDLRPLLHSFWTRGGISLIVLACKSNKDEKMNATSPLKAAELVNVYGTGMIQLDGGLEDAGKKMRNSFNWLMKAIREARGESRSYSSASTHVLDSSHDDEPHSPSTSIVAQQYLQHDHPPAGGNGGRHLSDPSGNPRPVTHHHVRKSINASDETSKISERVAGKVPEDSRQDDRQESTVCGPSMVSVQLETADEHAQKHERQTSSSASPLPSLPTQTVDPPKDSGLAPPQEVPTSASSRHAAQKAIVMSQYDPSSFSRGSEMDMHLDKHAIIDKFVFATVSGNESSFVDQFLIVFRRFATPFDVLSALITRFEFVSYHLEDDPLLTRYAHMKICHVLMTWVETYPGDFVKPTTLTVLKAFNTLILSATWLLHYAVEILPMSKAIGQMVDEDAGWALPDTTDESTVEDLLQHLTRLKAALAPALPRAALGLESEHSPTDELSKLDPELNTTLTDATSTSFRRAEEESRARMPNKLRETTHNDTQSSLGLKSTASSSLQVDPKAESKSLLEHSNLLISLPDELIALQITRLEWDIFAEMKPRHLIRYVLAPRDPKNPRVALRDPNSPIARSTDYLNHLAAWASSMILIQEKLKSRARVLLKLMKVAYELRDMDDFHSLMGVLAGIEAQPVYRLEATFEVVQHMDLQSYRRYLSLKRLMSSQRSFSAYRLARQTASAQCVPYLGTYLQDITAVNEVKDDMRDGKVNWTKFGQIAKASATVIECAKLAPEIEPDDRVEGLIIRVPILSEDAQYELSYKWKPRAGGSRVLGVNGSRASGIGGAHSKAAGASLVAVSASGSGTGVAKKGTRKLRQLINTAMQ